MGFRYNTYSYEFHDTDSCNCGINCIVYKKPSYTGQIQYTSQGLDHFVYKILRLDVCVHVTTCIVNKDKSQNFNQEYVNIAIAVASILLYL
jgi:hypothetical protein